MNLNRWAWPAILIFSSLTISLAAFLEWQSWARVLLALWFLLLCPGMSLQRLFGLRLPLPGWSLAVAFSLALDSLVGIILLYTGNWSWQTGLAVLAGLTVTAAILDILINRPIEPQPIILVTSVPAHPRKKREKVHVD